MYPLSHLYVSEGIGYRDSLVSQTDRKIGYRDSPVFQIDKIMGRRHGSRVSDRQEKWDKGRILVSQTDRKK